MSERGGYPAGPKTADQLAPPPKGPAPARNPPATVPRPASSATPSRSGQERPLLLDSNTCSIPPEFLIERHPHVGPAVRAPRRAVVLLAEGGRVHARTARERAAELGMPAVATDRSRRALRRGAVRRRVRARGRAADPRRLAHRAGAATPAGGDRERRARRRPARHATPTGTRTCAGCITDAHMLGERGDPWRRDRADLRARGRAGRAARAAVRSPGGWPSPAGSTRPRRAAEPFREAFGAERCFVAVEHRVERGSRDEVRAMLRFAERLERPRRGDEPRALPGARGRVPGRRARVHAADRADRAEPRHPRERRGLAEAGGGDARAVRRAAGPLRRHARRSPRRARSTWG